MTRCCFCSASQLLCSLLIFALAKAIDEGQMTTVEWIVLKYEFAPAAEKGQQQPADQMLSEDANEILFSICFCFSPAAANGTEPDNSSSLSNCNCQFSISGQNSWNATYPSSCLSQPEQDSGNKCLFAQVETDEASAVDSAYVRIEKGGEDKPLTEPEWQSLDMDAGNYEPKKRSARFAIRGHNNYARMTYALQKVRRPNPWYGRQRTTGNYRNYPSGKWGQEKARMGRPNANWNNAYKMAQWGNGIMRTTRRPATTPTTKMYYYYWTTTRRRTNEYYTTATTPVPPRPAPSPPVALSYYSAPCALLARMGRDDYQIRQYLMADALRQQIHPLQFDVQRYKQAVIAIHNRYRRLHGSVDLANNWGCEGAAKRWADGVLSRSVCLTHEPQKRYGESLYYFSTTLPYLPSPETMAEATVRTLYLEGNDYFMRTRFERQNTHRYGHFTQMVWRDTRNIGVGVTIMQAPASGPCTPSGFYGSAWLFYVVMRYDPPGNRIIGDEFAENVQPPERPLMSTMACLG